MRILLLEDDPAIAGTVLLRRAAPSPAAPAQADPPPLFELDEGGQRIRFGGQWLALTRLEFGLLRAVRPELEPIATHRGMGYSLEQPAR